MSFDAAAVGTSPTAWESHPRWPTRPPFHWSDATALLVVVAHADDETLGAAGLLAAAEERGIPTRVVVATDGAASTAGADADRGGELAAALSELAPGTTIRLLGFPDSDTERHRDQLRAALADEISAQGATALIATTWRLDGHRDHRVVGELVTELAGPRRVVEFPIWMWHWATPSDDIVPWESMRVIPVDHARKARAIARHTSQIAGDAPQLRPEFLTHFRRGEDVLFENARSELDRHFDVKYRASADPWGYRSRPYEARKRALTMTSLPRQRYRRALEIGCSIGTLTTELADRADSIVAVDLSSVALDEARRLPLERVEWVHGDARTGLPDGEFDLVVMSEVGYYWTADELDQVLVRIDDHLTSDGQVIACHWRAPIPDGPLTGDDVHAAIARRFPIRHGRYEEPAFVIEVASR